MSMIDQIRLKMDTKRAQRDELDRDLKVLEAMLNMEIRDASRSGNAPVMVQPPDPYPTPLLEAGIQSGVPAQQKVVKPPNYGDWTTSFRLTNFIVEILLEERPLKRSELIKRLKERDAHEDTHDFDNLVSHFLSKDPRFISPYYGHWTLAMEPVDDDKWHPDN